MFLIRFLYGLSQGFALPMSISLIIQEIPLKHRGKALICVNFFVTLGKFYGYIVASLTLKDTEEGNWRLLLSANSIFGLLVFLGTHFFLDESARYCLSVGRVDQGVHIINHMIKFNKRRKAILLDEFQVRNMGEIRDLYYHQGDENFFACLSDNPSLTFKVWFIWFFCFILSIGQLEIIEHISDGHHKSVSTYFIAIFGEIPSVIFALYIIDKPSFGRKRTLTVALFLAIFFNIFCYKCDEHNLTFYMLLTRLMTRLCLAMLFPFTVQIYRTNVRTSGFGMACGLGNLGGACISLYISTLDHHNY